MAKVRPIVMDIWGDPWKVTRTLDTNYDFPLLMGVPAQRTGHGESGRGTAIMTRPLADFLEAHRRFDDAAKWDLPIGKRIVKRLRSLLGHHKVHDSQEWWLDRIADLRELEYQEFAKKHRCTKAAAAVAHQRLIGKRNLDHGWYREEPYRSQLLADRPLAAIASEMELTADYVSQLRIALNREK